MYDSISDRHKLRFERLGDSEIRLANDDKIRIHGIAKLQAIIHSHHEVIEEYILPTSSHPLIHGTEYLKANKIVLDFSDFSCNQKNVPIKTTKRLEIGPNSEYLTFGTLPQYITTGLQEICVNSKFSVNRGLMVVKSLVVTPVNHKVPVKLLNASNNKITNPKGKNIADFSILSDDYTYISLPEQLDIPEVQNIQVVGGELDPEINDSKPHYENTKRSDLIDNIKK